MKNKATMWLTVKQASTYLNVCPLTVRKMIKANKIRANKMVTGDWRIDALYLTQELDRTCNIHSRRPEEDAIITT